MNRRDEIILLAHGGGGVQTQRLIRDLIIKYFDNPILRQMDDSARLPGFSGEVIFSTDSYVVDPFFFPGGNIGTLAACGTINDLVMQGARPRYLSMGLILEEGLSMDALEQILSALAEVLNAEGVQLVTGDTKVVNKGQANGIFINTAGIGTPVGSGNPGSACAEPGDVVILTGTLGDHGMAVMGQRKGLNLQTDLLSDVAPLSGLILPLIEAGHAIHVLRDPTRGGVAAALCDIAAASKQGITVREQDLPVRKEVKGMCDLLGLDPLVVANEGKAIVICPEPEASAILGKMHAHPLGRDAAVIGRVTPSPTGKVTLLTRIGGQRAIEMPQGEMLPRIC